MTDPIVLVCANTETGHVSGVGIYETLDLARLEAHKAAGPGKIFTVWTPKMNNWIAGATITGLSMPPQHK